MPIRFVRMDPAKAIRLRISSKMRGGLLAIAQELADFPERQEHPCHTRREADDAKFGIGGDAPKLH